jgi:hypothetical protein
MRRRLALLRRLMPRLALPALLAAGCASGGPPAPATGGTSALDAANRALAEQPAIVELRSGEVARDVEGVVMTAETTSWRDGDRERTVPTVEVVKVTREIRFRAGKGLAWGLLVGVPVGLIVGSTQSGSANQGFFAISDRAAATVVADLACGLLGMVVAGVFRQPPDRVVYRAPGVSGEAHRSALAPVGGGEQHCRLASARTRPGSPGIECGPPG